MDKTKIIYAITLEDVFSVSKEYKIKFTEKDIPFIKDRVGDYFGSQWFDAIYSVLNELNTNKENNLVSTGTNSTN